MKIWIVCTTVPGETKPCIPNAFDNAAAAEAYLEEMLKAEWEHNGVYDDAGCLNPYPGNWREAQEQIVNNNSEGTWGKWELSEHDV